jgi:hypothetical protein
VHCVLLGTHPRSAWFGWLALMDAGWFLARLREGFGGFRACGNTLTQQALASDIAHGQRYRGLKGYCFEKWRTPPHHTVVPCGGSLAFA